MSNCDHLLHGTGLRVALVAGSFNDMDMPPGLRQIHEVVRDAGAPRACWSCCPHVYFSGMHEAPDLGMHPRPLVEFSHDMRPVKKQKYCDAV